MVEDEEETVDGEEEVVDEEEQMVEEELEEEKEEVEEDYRHGWCCGVQPLQRLPVPGLLQQIDLFQLRAPQHHSIPSTATTDPGTDGKRRAGGAEEECGENRSLLWVFTVGLL